MKNKGSISQNESLKGFLGQYSDSHDRQNAALIKNELKDQIS